MSRDGFTAFDKALGRVAAEAQNPQGIRDAGNFILSAAKLKCSGFRLTSGELRTSLDMVVQNDKDGVFAHIGTNKEYAPYVEFGTGPTGAARHNGISPDVNPVYRLTPWWIHESMVDPEVPLVYHWSYIDTDQGRFYHVSGQPAHPYLYPAFADNEKAIKDIIAGGFEKAVEGDR